MTKDNTFGVYNVTSSRCTLFWYVVLRLDNRASVTGVENHSRAGNMDVEMSSRPSTSRAQTGFQQLSGDLVGGGSDTNQMFGDEHEGGLSMLADARIAAELLNMLSGEAELLGNNGTQYNQGKIRHRMKREC